MRELGLVVAITLGLVGLGTLARVPFDDAVHWGVLLTAWGLALGVPTGVAYHVQLARVLGRRGALPSGWYWNPFALHPRLREDERLGVLLWCGAGAVGLGVCALGLAVLGVPTVAMLVELYRDG